MQRIHVCMQEPFIRAGGLHSYVRGLTTGQKELDLSPVILDRISRTGKFGIAGSEILRESDDSVAEYHFAHGAFPFIFPPRASWRESPRLFHFHGPWHLEGAVQGDSSSRVLMKKLLEKMVYSRFSQFIVASDYFGITLNRLFKVPENRIQTVYPGVDSARFAFRSNTTDARIRLGVPQDAFVAATVRRLEPRMGIEDAFLAIKELSDVYLVVAGTGSLDQRLRLLSRELGIENRVKFLGRISDEDLPLVYQAADVSLVPTRDLEGFGMVVLESMSAGTPVIATTVGGLPEAMGPFAERWTVAPSSPAALTQRIREIADETSFRSEVRTYATTRSNREMAKSVERVISTIS